MPPKPHEESPADALEPTDVDENSEQFEENDNNDEEEECLLTKAEQLYELDKVNQTAKILRSLDQSTLEEKHHAMLRYVHTTANSRIAIFFFGKRLPTLNAFMFASIYS